MSMQIQLIRNATLRVEYAGKRFVIDPYLAARHSRPTIRGISLNPLVELPCTSEQVLEGIEMAVISHLHSDHFDPAAQALLPKHIPVLCQPEDRVKIESKGFRDVRPVGDSLEWLGITITRTSCRHGSGSVLDEMGDASGFVFRAEGEPTVYWVGDSVWCPEVSDVIGRFQPDIIITHSCAAVWDEGVLIVMDAAQTLDVCRSAPQSKVIAVHMEALDHATLTRAALRHEADANGVGPERLLIPDDGDFLVLE